MELIMEIIKKETKNANETKNFAKKIASIINNNAIIVLTGELGSGKTKFVEGFLEYYNLQDEISSPTFNLVNEYCTENCSIYHFDVYRLETSDEFYEFGGEEYFSKGICIIEWGEIIQDILPKDYIQIIFTKDSLDENKRNLELKLFGDSQKYFSVLKNI